LRQPYGLILIAKASVFALLLVLAALNRWRFTPALLPGLTPTLTPAAACGALRRSIVTEYLLIAGVLAMTAALTSLYSPEH
jgi:copper resistance protein D